MMKFLIIFSFLFSLIGCSTLSYQEKIEVFSEKKKLSNSYSELVNFCKENKAEVCNKENTSSLFSSYQQLMNESMNAGEISLFEGKIKATHAYAAFDNICNWMASTASECSIKNQKLVKNLYREAVTDKSPQKNRLSTRTSSLNSCAAFYQNQSQCKSYEAK